MDTSEAGTCVIVQPMLPPEVLVQETGVVPVPPELDPVPPELPPLPPPELPPLPPPELPPLPPPDPPPLLLLLVPLHWLLQAVHALAWLERQELQPELTLL